MSHYLRPCEQEKCRVVSFDVFDTLLLRKAHSERTRFREAARFHQNCLLPIKRFSTAELFALRSHCHRFGYRVAPLVQGQREAGLELVFRMLCAGLNIGSEWVEPLIEAEILFEAKNLRPNLPLMREISGLKERGKRIYLVSDMYLRDCDVARLFARLCPWLAYDGIFVSGDHGVSKHSNGNLFPLFLDRIGASADEVVHVGDNLKSDVRQARRHGVQAIHLPRSAFFYAGQKLHLLLDKVRYG